WVVCQSWYRLPVTEVVPMHVEGQVNGAIVFSDAHRDAVMVVGYFGGRNGIICEQEFFPLANRQFFAANRYLERVFPVGHILVAVVGRNGVLLERYKVSAAVRCGRRSC